MPCHLWCLVITCVTCVVLFLYAVNIWGNISLMKVAYTHNELGPVAKICYRQTMEYNRD